MMNMKIDWQNDAIYKGDYVFPKKLKIEDLAGGIGMFTIEVGIMTDCLIQYLVNNKYLKKNQSSTVRIKLKLESKGDALCSTLGPIVEKIKIGGVAYPKDVDSLTEALNERNWFQHEFVHDYIVNNGSMDLGKVAPRLIKDINNVRKITNRYMSENEKFRSDDKKNKQKAQAKSIIEHTKYSKQQLIETISRIIAESPRGDNREYPSVIGKKLTEMGIRPKDYKYPKLSVMLEDLGFKTS